MPAVDTLPVPVSSLPTDETSVRSFKILEATTDLVAMTDRRGHLLYLNATGRRLLGLTIADALDGRQLSELQPNWATEVVLEEGFPIARFQGSWSGETAILSANGSELPVLQVLLSHKDANGEVEFLSTICRDITDRKQKELERIEWANRYDAAIRASGQVVFDWDTGDGRITYGGDTEGLLGFSAEALEGGMNRLRTLVHPTDLPRFDLEIEHAVLNRDPFQHEFRAHKRDGTEIIISAQGCFFLDRQGRIGRMVGFLKDVTSARASERDIQLANEHLEERVAERTAELERAHKESERGARRQEALARLGQHALAGTSLDELMVEAINTVCQMMPVDCASLLKYDESAGTLHVVAEAGWPASEPPDSTPVEKDSQGAYTLKTGAPVITPNFLAENRFRVPESVLQAGVKSGLCICIKSAARSLGVLSMFSLTPRDFSPLDVSFVQSLANVVAAAGGRHRADDEIRQAQSDAESANRAKSEFLSRMSHELRTPLNAILGFTQLLEMEEHTEKQSESIAHISRAGGNLLDLINEVLDIARLDAGRVQFHVETIDVLELIREVVSISGLAAAKRRIEFRIADPGGDQPFVSADRERLRQILLNLLSNGVKFNHDGGSVTLAVARMDGGCWRISVTDTGIGIPAEKLSRLFVPFERLGTREGGTEGGTGLGLALCQRLAKGLGGRLGVASTVALGSTFWLELPEAEVAPHLDLEEGRTQDDGAAQTPAQPSRVVLYIEDEVTNYQLLERVLVARKDIKLLSALNGQTGISLALEHRPDLILLDMNLPDMTGEQVLRALKAEPATAGIEIIAVTGDILGPRAKELKELGITATLLKPYRLADLAALMDRSFSAKK